MRSRVLNMRSENRGKSQARQRRTSDTEQSFAFRRSRTITGSAATSVRAAGEERGQLQSSRLHEHSLRKHRRRIMLYLGASIVACMGLWYVVSNYMGEVVTAGTRSTQALVVPLEVTPYKALVTRYFDERPFERFRFALNESTFSRFMTINAPEVSSAVLEKGSGLGNAELALDLREPVVAWTIKNQQYFVDADGAAFTKNYFAVPGVVVTDKSGISAEAGVVASGKLLRFIGRVITLVNVSGTSTVESVELPVNSTREVDFKLKDKGYIIKAHLDRDPAGQAADIVNAVSYVEAKGISPAYLDVRVSSKAFYRPR